MAIKHDPAGVAKTEIFIEPRPSGGFGAISVIGSLSEGSLQRQLVREGRLVRVGQGRYARARPSMTGGEPVPVGGLSALKEALGRVGVETGPSRLDQAYNA